MDFCERTFSSGFGNVVGDFPLCAAARLALTTSTICLTPLAVVALAFATLPMTFAAFEMVSLLALRKDAADPTARGMDEVTPLSQSNRVVSNTGKMYCNNNNNTCCKSYCNSNTNTEFKKYCNTNSFCNTSIAMTLVTCCLIR
jgi:hypothetical protein